MKKPVMVIVLFQMFVLQAITPSITVGMQNSNVNYVMQGKYYVELSVRQDVGDLSLYGIYRNEMDLSGSGALRFAPMQDYYTVGASYGLGYAMIRLEHMCMHPVVSSGSWYGLQGGYTKLEVQL